MSGATGHYFVSADAVALSAATAKSVVELATTANTRAFITEWWVDFDGVTPTNTPVKVEWGRFSAAVTTASSITPEKYITTDDASSITAKYNTTVEGAGTADDIMYRRINPTTGIHIQYPLDGEFCIPKSGFFRIRCTAAQVVNVTFGVCWKE